MTRRILFCSPSPVTATLGAAKVYIEVADAFRRHGWHADVIGPEHLKQSPGTLECARALRDYLQRHAVSFDVVEYEQAHLPFSRQDFPSGTLMVARSVLLTHAVIEARIPLKPTWRALIGRLVKGSSRRRETKAILERAQLTLNAADLINVSNDDDQRTLLRYGHDENKIMVQPFGLFPERLDEFPLPTDNWAKPPIIAFVGTFDPRKGMRELPRLLAMLAKMRPIRLRLLGTAGMLRTVDEVAACFPKGLRDAIEVVPHFEPAALPKLLADCAVGVFLSRCEGFPFGILEMLAAGLPVFAFRAPGPPAMLPDEQLAAVGDWRSVAGMIMRVLDDESAVRTMRLRARERAEQFRWVSIAADTACVYEDRLQKLRQSTTEHRIEKVD